MNMDYFLVILFFFFSGDIVSSEWTTPRGRDEAIRCFDEMIQDGEITNLLIDVTTPLKIDDFCRRHAALQKCIRDNEHYLTVSENTDYLQKTSGVRKFFINVCPPGTDVTQDYKGNAPCFKLIKNEILSCGSTLPDTNNYKMKTDILAKCCALQKHRECLKKVAAEHCGNEAAQVVEKIVLRYYEPQSKDCRTLPSSNCDDNKSTTVLGWSSTVHRPHYKRDGIARWNSETTKYYKHYSMKNDEWKGTTVADVWKKDSENNGAIVSSLNSVISIFSCLVAIFLHRP